MILYVDETENKDSFILVGLLADNRHAVNMAFRHFKNRIKYFHIKQHAKEKVYVEFKSIILDKHYQRIKRVMLEEIVKINGCLIMYSIKHKIGGYFKQSDKEKAYINLITKLAQKCSSVSVVFDCFNNPQFETKIVDELFKLSNVINVKPMNSQEEPGLIFADNLCGAIRLHVSGLDNNNFYYDISSYVVEI